MPPGRRAGIPRLRAVLESGGAAEYRGPLRFDRQEIWAVGRLTRLSMLAFAESLAATLVGRGLFFYTHDQLNFTDAENLGLAVAGSAVYVVGALGSHRLTARWSEKRVMAGMIAGQIVAWLALFLWPAAGMAVAASAVLGFCNGTKWPVIESYFTAGQTPAGTARAVGRFALSWVPALPLALCAAGPLIAWDVRGLFAVAMGLGVASLLIVRTLERRPVHLAEDHPERPTEGELARCRALLASSRCSMITNYALMTVLAALMPRVLADLGMTVVVATALAGVLEVVRGLAFITLHRWTGWHNRGLPLAAVIVGFPAGFLLVLIGPNVWAVIVGEIVFGLAAGLTYYASLYYSMVVENASVEGGGTHEGLVGSGSALGPVAGVAGGLVPGLGPAAGVLAGVGPLVGATSAGAAWFLVRARQTRSAG
jgi:predicted MFS family arabinose efflux permease